jgi:hypothetical protein
MVLKNDRGNDRTATGFPGQDRAKFGQPRRGDDAVRADEAAALNNGNLRVELVDGRCGYDGLPEGTCGHFPGYQDVQPGPYGTDAEEYEGPVTRADGSSSVDGIGAGTDSDDQKAKAENAAKQKDATAKDSGSKQQ